MVELEARVRALLRRRSIPQQKLQKFGTLDYDAGTRQLFHGETEIELPRRELAVFDCLFAAKGRLVPKSTVLDQVYGVGADVADTVVEVYVSRLRQRLKAHGIQIKTQRGLGYRLLVGTCE
jgi:two-component system OmpR family response regulator